MKLVYNIDEHVHGIEMRYDIFCTHKKNNKKNKNKQTKATV